MQFLYAIALLIASAFITVALTPKPERPKPASLEDFDFPQIDETTPQSVVFGDVWISDWIVLWYGNLRSTAIKSKGGKK